MNRVAIALIVGMINMGLVVVAFSVGKSERPPDRRAERICWQVKTSLEAEQLLARSNDLAMAGLAKTVVAAYEPLDAICKETP